MKQLTPAKLVMLVFVAMGCMIVLYVVKTLTARETPPPVNTTRIIPMLVGDLEPGTVITDRHLGRGPWPGSDIKDDVLLSENGIIGRVVKTPIEAATPIHGAALYPHGQLPPLRVSEGYRAVTISIREQAAIMNGLIKPGDFVDIQFTPRDLAEDPRYELIGGMSIKLFKGVRVLALNRDFVQTPIQATNNSITLEIANEDTGILDLAARKGDLTLNFTKDGDGRATVEVENPDRPTLEEILQLPPLPEPPPPPPAPPAPPEPDRFTSRVYRRSAMATHNFVDGVPSSGGSGSGYNTDYHGGGAGGNGAIINGPNSVFIPSNRMNQYMRAGGSPAYGNNYRQYNPAYGGFARPYGATAPVSPAPAAR
ncbi:MAG: Flp pilus assembly protein CpaB [Planctomycetota bacterium]